MEWPDDAAGRLGMAPEPARSVRGLSPREWDVALLVAAGLKDAAIGARLGLSPATVATHVQRIRHRLKLTGRAEIAAWVAARRTPGSSQAHTRRIGDADAN
jgi:non-specific serine/threonine protein kinase